MGVEKPLPGMLNSTHGEMIVQDRFRFGHEYKEINNACEAMMRKKVKYLMAQDGIMNPLSLFSIWLCLLDGRIY